MCNHKAIAMPNLETIAAWVRQASTFYNDGVPILYVASDTAPNKYSQLKAWGRNHKVGVDVLPVYSGGCDSTIYPTPDDNHMFRAWHDAIHIRESYSFKPEDESKVSDMHCAVLTHVGAPYAIVKAVEADVLGQVLYYQETGEYVNNQRLFVTQCLEHSIGAVMSGVRNGARY